MSKTVFVMTCFEKTAVVDDYNEGETGKENCFSMDVTVQDEDLKKCLEKAFEFLGMDYDENNMFIPDDGRYVDIGRLEDDDGDTPSNSGIELWKKGLKRLWSATYYWSVVKRTEEDVDVRKELGLE